MTRSIFELDAVNDDAFERLPLGRSADHIGESPRYRVLIHAMFWGAWKGKRVRLLATSHPSAKACEDVTDALAATYLLRHPGDEEVRRVVAAPTDPMSLRSRSKRTTMREEVVIDAEFEEIDDE